VAEPKWLDDREARAWRGLQEMQLRLTAELSRQVAADSKLSYSDYVVLVALTAEPEGRMRPFELGHMLGWEQSRVSHHIARMTERGLVTKQECPSDRRGAYVAVTDLGRAEIEAAAPGHVEAVRRLFIDHLDHYQLDVLGDIAQRVLDRMDGEGAGSGPEREVEGLAP
jgi:DNA-binding MarR family transcriptional regulator